MSTDQASLFPLPEGASTHMFQGSDGWPLRSLVWRPATASQTVVLLGGRGDFAEKYAELITNLLASGFAVATMDWRGQGLSGEMTPPPRRTHINDFSVWIDDAKVWLHHVVAQTCPHPGLLLAHSMGGHLGLRLMHDLPGQFQKAVLLCPMLGILTQPFSPKFARRVAALAVRMGRGERLGFGQLPHSTAWAYSGLRMNRLTSDRARYLQEAAAIEANPRLAIGGVTYGWVKAAFESCDLLATPGYAESIETPALMFAAEREVLVDNAAAQQFSARMPHCRFDLVADGRHELFRERDAIRAPVVARLLAWLKGEPA